MTFLSTRKGSVSVHRLSPTNALGGEGPRTDRIGRHVLEEVPDVPLASIASRSGREQACAAVLEELIGTAPPGPGEAVGDAALSAFWMGPDQWMVAGPPGDRELLADELATAFAGDASVTEQSGAWAQFDLRGEAVRDVLERLCALPVRKMTPGMANRTRIHGMGCFVICRPAGFSILGPRSSADSLHHAVVGAMTSVG